MRKEELLQTIQPYVHGWIEEHHGSIVIARSTARQNVADSTHRVINYNLVDVDTQRSVTTGNGWQFRASEAGVYQVAAAVMFIPSANWGPGKVGALSLWRDGVRFAYLDRRDDLPTGSSLNLFLSGSRLVYLAAGQTLDARVIQGTGSSLEIHPEGSYNWISIVKIGGSPS